MRTKIYGHRGSSGVCPENTMLSFKTALEQGADGIELDVQLSKDGVPVVIHDETLERTTNGTGFVKDFTATQLQTLNAGQSEKIPTLEDVLHLIAGTSAELNIELKTVPFLYTDIEEKVLSTVHKAGAENMVIYSSFHLPTLLRLKSICSNARIAWLLAMGFPLPHPADCIETLSLDALHLEKKMLLANPTHYAQVYDKIRVWTVNNSDETESLINFGVAAVITDYPEMSEKFC
ncbi:MAG: glycerophosphodiester phosphodiesterase [Oscillospiraceae bacterium]|nr:glycerophosphodiester phosphodiesterase [Oscillospiraceae bacterium]